jgi:hypothetical protein
MSNQRFVFFFGCVMKNLHEVAVDGPRASPTRLAASVTIRPVSNGVITTYASPIAAWPGSSREFETPILDEVVFLTGLLTSAKSGENWKVYRSRRVDLTAYT